MKAGWEKKVWNDVLKILNGKNQKAVEDINGKYPIYGSGGIMGYANDYICPEHSVIVGRKGNIDKPIYVDCKFWNVDTAFGLVANSDILNSRYLFYFCKVFNFQKLNKAVTIPSLTKSDLLKINMLIPPIDEQETIVAELDSLSSIIAKHKQLAEEYDRLEQSIFHDMFGDPVTNDKGWEVKKLDDVISLKRGFDLPTKQRDEYGDVPVYGASGIVGYHSESKIPCGIVTGRSGTIGEVIMVDVPFWPLNTTLYSYQTHGNNLKYLEYLLRNFDLKRFVEGAGVPTLNRNVFLNNDIINVPLSLQTLFAEKIQHIEAMKAANAQAQKEAETLFAERMNFYFGE